ncbi:glycosyltransferase family 4 protein [Streptacidiphilus rugosus]|uniref:glycosyltransferase family 4 protein n=1 Tax=Streptacidiphilus rugosus TaxID=405783 RepID=UPI000691C907|nr:glycosyltransferase family 4 protein [Streptacidiphilus rugosus]
MRTIVQITPYYPPHLGGLERVVEHLAAQLGRRHPVRVVTTTLGAAGAPRRGVQAGVAVRRHRAREVAHTAIAPGMALELLRLPREAVLHLHCAHALLPELVALTAVLRRQRYLVHFHLDVDASGRLGRLLPLYKKHVFGRVLRAAAGVIVLTESQAAFVRDAYRIPPERVHVVPNGVGADYFMPIRDGAGRDGAATRPLELLFVGRLSPQKNVGLLLEALGQVRGPVRLRVVGDGEEREALTARAARLGIADRVEFTGGLLGGDLLDAYRRADVFVLPSQKEGMALVALEAMAAALPIVATDVPGNHELLDGVGVLVTPTAPALAEALDAVAADPERRTELARRSAATAAGHSWDAVARRVEQVYAEVFP